MRIAMMTNNYKPVIGGVPISIERLAQGLRKRGHTVYIFAPDCGHTQQEPFVIRCKTLDTRLTGEFPVPSPFDPGIEDMFRCLQIDLIHVHHPMVMGQIALHLGEKYQIPVVYTYHTRYEMYLHYLKPYAALEEHARENRAAQEAVHCIRDVTVPGLIRSFMRRCDLIFAPTPTMAEYLESENLPVPVRVMPTGLSSQAYFQEPSAVQTLREYFLEDKKYLLTTVSRLAKEKNFDFMLRALAVLKEQIGDVFRVLVIGDGPERENLEQLANSLWLSDNIAFLGFLPNDQLGMYHRAGDCFLFSSCSETQGIVLLEAMAAHTPVVALEASGVRDVVENGVNGFMTAPDEWLWATRVRQILERESLRKRLGENAYQTALRYRGEDVARIAEESYRQVLDGRALTYQELGLTV